MDESASQDSMIHTLLLKEMCRYRRTCSPHLCEYWHDVPPESVLLPKPGLECLAVVAAIDVPLLLNGEMLLEVEQQVQGGHGATREEIPGHPVGLIFHLQMLCKTNSTGTEAVI